MTRSRMAVLVGVGSVAKAARVPGCQRRTEPSIPPAATMWRDGTVWKQVTPWWYKKISMRLNQSWLRERLSLFVFHKHYPFMLSKLFIGVGMDVPCYRFINIWTVFHERICTCRKRAVIITLQLPLIICFAILWNCCEVPETSWLK